MSDSWDYGQAEQVSDEYDHAMKAGYCYRCAVYKPDIKGQPCHRCLQDEDEARLDDDRYDV